mmetsp:Transcript_5191/g.10127  ORF Transcript_5191/g.10127 Transcript_5191/m.10127 type:complete len:412 (-) Transcript_5191:199-1434(-)|eukprot:CAMPEP_0167825522 /NCGR_PEP_ID=MMETSP0112_2-20121227/9425_1 /TAXON_ID=91324 /ORGANISM="Lotharella globosa, Strain CCCM811" /LENGTH=411 /DNA_ID=CAMNT_0007727663 /DNA_START=55 /DNA_END=1290 /DNA_ORIENTATION=+
MASTRTTASLSSGASSSSLDLSWRWLDVTPQGIEHEEVKTIDLRGNEMEVLDLKFERLPSLQELNLNDNDLTGLPEDIKKLRALKKLSLVRNRIRSLPQLKHLTSLTVLNLFQNQIQELPDLAKADKLEKLILTRNRFAHVPESLNQLRALKTLKIAENAITSLGDVEFKGLDNLSTLDFHENQVEELPESIGLLTKMETLVFARNNVKGLPESLQKMTDLKLFHASHNLIEAIPPNILLAFKNLESMDFSANRLRMIPSTIKGCKSLCFLDVSHNRLRALPAELGSLPHLHTIYARGNKLRGLPDSFGNSRSLEDLDLRHNRLTTAPACFASLRLKRARIRDNPIASPELRQIIRSEKFGATKEIVKWTRRVEKARRVMMRDVVQALGMAGHLEKEVSRQAWGLAFRWGE